MCGIVGVVARSPVNHALLDALTVLQHRGQDAAGVVTCAGQRLHLKKGLGLVRDVFSPADARALQGAMGIAHVRYPTAGSCSTAEAQPFYVNSPYGITLAHNGNLTNTRQLLGELREKDLRHINTGSDSEIILNIFAHELQAVGRLEPTPDDVFRAVAAVHRRCRGAYAIVAMITGYGVVGLRDPHGIRPLCFGHHAELGGTDTLIASESVALHALGYKLARDLEPGEAIYVEADGTVHTRQCAPDHGPHTPCIFEYVYLARPDSIIDGVSVYQSRLTMGDRLAAKVNRLRPDHDIDVIIPIPDTSRTAALQMANTLGLPYREGFIKNRYIGRTFIMPGQSVRKASVRRKLNAIDSEFAGKVVMLVDDSIVRGTTCRQIIQMAREAGAKKVYYASAAPEVRHPNVYGIDMPAARELIAHGRTADDIAELIGADWLVYQDLDDLIDAVRINGGQAISRFDTSIFDGRYVTGDVDQGLLQAVSDDRSDEAKQRREADAESESSMVMQL